MTKLDILYSAYMTVQKALADILENRDKEWLTQIVATGCCTYTTVGNRGDFALGVTVDMLRNDNVLVYPAHSDSWVEPTHFHVPTEELFKLCESLLKDEKRL